MDDAATADPSRSLADRRFVGQIEKAAADLGLSVRWLSGHWIAQLTRGTGSAYLCGYTFPLNSAVSTQLATDKVATHVVLAEAGLPSVPHHILDTDPGATIGRYGLPLVVKPCEGYGGRHVYRVRSVPEFESALAALAPFPGRLAVSPWVSIIDEYRILLLDGEPLLAYRKVRTGDSWQHNLSHGAVPRLLTPADTGRLTGLATAATTALVLRFAAVDLVSTAGGLRVLEVNAKVTLERFSAHSPEYHALAEAAYRAALARCLP